jgi:hypothetical protein
VVTYEATGQVEVGEPLPPGRMVGGEKSLKTGAGLSYQKTRATYDFTSNEGALMLNSRAVFPLAVTARRPARIAPLLAAVAFGLSSPHAADAQMVVSNDFEDGTTQGWIPRGSALLTNTTEAANTGTASRPPAGRPASTAPR